MGQNQKDKDDQGVVAWTYCGKTTEIFGPAVWSVCQRKKTELKKQQQYKKGILEVRRPGAIKHVPVLDKSKLKNYGSK